MKHVMIIDDNKSVRDTFELILTNHDGLCELVGDPRDALSLLIRYHNKYDLIFCDYNMPYMTGAMLVLMLRHINMASLIVGMSGNNANKIRFQSFGVYLFLNKPFDLERVLGLVDRID